MAHYRLISNFFLSSKIMETWITMSKILHGTQNMILYYINNIINKIKSINPDHGNQKDL